MNSTEKKSVLSLAFLYSTRMLGLFMVLPVFMIYGQDLGGANELLLGIAIGAYGLSQALFQVPFGALSDRFGRKPLIMFGLMLFFIGSVVAAMSEHIYGVIIGRFLQGAGAIAARQNLNRLALAARLAVRRTGLRGQAAVNDARYGRIACLVCGLRHRTIAVDAKVQRAVGIGIGAGDIAAGTGRR